MSKFLATLALVVFSVVGFGEEHKLNKIVGSDIDLKLYDHTIAGSILDFVVFGNMDEGKFESQLTMKKDGQLINATFGKSGSSLGGVIKHTVGSRVVETRVQMAGVDPKNQIIRLRLNDKLVEVHVSGDGFEDNHFINPKYFLTLDQKVVEFKVENDRACYGFSAHLLMMILGAYFHGAI